MVSVVENCFISELNANYNLTGARRYKQNFTQIDNLSEISGNTLQGHDCNTLTVNSFRNLFRIYTSHMAGSSMNMDTCPDVQCDQGVPPIILAGGLQQYLIKNIKKNKENIVQPRKGEGSEHVTFHDLPDSIHLKIFSYLTISELCVSSCVCRQWYCVASDSILWRDRLDRDIRSWDVISHTTNPYTYQDGQTDWTNKEIYLRCSPDVNRVLKQKYLNFNSVTNFFRTFWPKKTPRIVMFGPGLESATSLIARKILEDKSGMFTTTAMFPGQFEGIGSGFTMKMASGAMFHLITLYTSTRQERESRPRNERLQHSRLLTSTQRQSQQEDYEVRGPVKDLCRTIDGFIFVVDGSKEENMTSSAVAEFKAMINPAYVSDTVPVAVASCVPSTSSYRVPCVDVTQCLGLDHDMTRPWQVRDCTVDTMTGVVELIEWVVEHAHKTK